MNYEQALEFLSTSKNVEDWNQKRDKVKQYLSTQEMALIDSSGLICKVLNNN